MAQIELLGLYEGTPQIAAAQTGDTYKGNVTLQAATGNEVAYEFASTTNKATSGNDTTVLISMTDTASPGTSYPLDIQVGGSSVFGVDSIGRIVGASTMRISPGGTDELVLDGTSLRPNTSSGLALGNASRIFASSYFSEIVAANAFTVSSLSSTLGAIARVTDADTPSVGSTVVGGGAAAALVWYNGANWTVIGV